ncbi:hypothetical protein [Streptomyces sp. SP18CS02]|uniref:hypothetical protein n=1 Tax=Streptomyces sp. SP18CS02 TaxID=3002531 RepID=UPI002E75B8C6|nr:hypothetical protein [Streptomyces sp. SP18CS02]MEE1755935.1 hypothetical protein [Streptomyces sp. SP18CS02]
METRDSELGKELDATLQARRELGTEYESALIESFLEKLERRLDGAVDRRVRRQVAEQQMVVARGGRPAVGRDGENFGERFGFAVVSLVLAVPLTAIATGAAGFRGLVVTWLGVIGVNAVHAARGRLRWPREQRGTSDRDAA